MGRCAKLPLTFQSSGAVGSRCVYSAPRTRTRFSSLSENTLFVLRRKVSSGASRRSINVGRKSLRASAHRRRSALNAHMNMRGHVTGRSCLKLSSISSPRSWMDYGQTGKNRMDGGESFSTDKERAFPARLATRCRGCGLRIAPYTAPKRRSHPLPELL